MADRRTEPVLVISHHPGTGFRTRSLEIARGLSRSGPVYYLDWEVSKGARLLHHGAALLRGLFRRVSIEDDGDGLGLDGCGLRVALRADRAQQLSVEPEIVEVHSSPLLRGRPCERPRLAVPALPIVLNELGRPGPVRWSLCVMPSQLIQR